MMLLAGSVVFVRLVMLCVLIVVCDAVEKVPVRISVGNTRAPVVGSMVMIFLGTVPS